jgi:hypothetical protein
MGSIEARKTRASILPIALGVSRATLNLTVLRMSFEWHHQSGGRMRTRRPENLVSSNTAGSTSM